MAKLYVAILVLLAAFSCHATNSKDTTGNKSGEKIAATTVTEQIVVDDHAGLAGAKKDDINPAKADNAKPKQLRKPVPANAKKPAVVKVKKRPNEMGALMKLLKQMTVYSLTAKGVLQILYSFFKLQAALGDVEDEHKEAVLTKIVDYIMMKHVQKLDASEMERAKQDIQALAKPGKKEDILKKQEEGIKALEQAMVHINEAANNQASLDKGKTQTQAKPKAKPDKPSAMESLAEKSPRIKMAWKLYEGILQIAKTKQRYESSQKTSMHSPKHPNSAAHVEDTHNTPRAPPSETATLGDGKGEDKVETDNPMLGLLYAYGLQHFRVDDQETQKQNERKATALMTIADQKMGPELVKEMAVGVASLQAAYDISLQIQGKKDKPKQGGQKKRGVVDKEIARRPQVVVLDPQPGDLNPLGVGQNGGTPVPGEQDDEDAWVDEDDGARPNKPKRRIGGKGEKDEQKKRGVARKNARRPQVVPDPQPGDVKADAPGEQDDEDLPPDAPLTAKHDPTAPGRVAGNKGVEIVVPPAGNH